MNQGGALEQLPERKTFESASVGTVLIFQSSPGFGAVASFHGTGSCTPIPLAGYQGFGKKFSGDFWHFSHSGTSSVPFWYHFDSKLGGT